MLQIPQVVWDCVLVPIYLSIIPTATSSHFLLSALVNVLLRRLGKVPTGDTLEEIPTGDASRWLHLAFAPVPQASMELIMS